MISSLLAR